MKQPHTGHPQDTQADRPVRAEGELVMREDGWFLRISTEELRRLEREAAESLSNPAESTSGALSPSPALPSSPKPRGTPT